MTAPMIHPVPAEELAPNVEAAVRVTTGNRCHGKSEILIVRSRCGCITIGDMDQERPAASWPADIMAVLVAALKSLGTQ